MLEQMLNVDVAKPAPKPPPVWLFDPTTGKDLVNNNATLQLLNGAVVNDVRPINGRNTINWAATNARAVVVLPTPLVLGEDWTIEWEANTAPMVLNTDYLYEIIGDLVQASNFLYTVWGDSGYSFQMRMCCGPTDNQAYIWRSGWARNVIPNGPRQHAFVSRKGVVEYYQNGVKQSSITNWNATVNSGQQVTTPTWTVRATNPAIKQFRLGAANDSLKGPINGGFGRIRISNYARYSTSYAPTELTL